MSDVLYLRPIEPPVSPADVPGMLRLVEDCFRMHKVDWSHSFLADDGRRMMCWYRAPDAESARVALRQVGSDMNSVWTGRVLNGGADAPPVHTANFIAEIPLASVDGDVVQACEALTGNGPTFLRGFASLDGQRLVTVFRADDARSVGAAVDRAGLAAEMLWRCTPIGPASRGG